MGRLTVAFLWHMHQPCYVDRAAGAATLPWVRLHALKDYSDLPALARRFAPCKQTFNLVPSLLDQLDAYAQGRLVDPYLELACRPAGELSHEDRRFLLREFFSYNPPTMAARLPRLEELRRMRGARPPAPGDFAALAVWREADYRDLQVLFQLAWSGPALSAHPKVARLIAKGRGFSPADQLDLGEVQREFLAGIVDAYADGAREGTLDISTSPYYHPILPLLCDTDSAREATPRLSLPDRAFRHPEDARLQVREARRAIERRFGMAPSGLWPSEGALSQEALRLIGEEGVRWTASDADLLFASLRDPAPRDFASRSRILHRPYASPDGMLVFFRDHSLSDRIGFVYSSWGAGEAADDFLERLRAIADAAGGEERIVSVILDGENAWEFYPGNGLPFLSALFERIRDADGIEAESFSSIAARLPREGPEPVSLPPLRAGSWIRADLTTWIGHEEKNRAWDLLAEARALGPPAPGTPSGDCLLAAEGSDWFWWFGDEHSSAHDADFDRTFRLHLQNAYRFADREAPVVLSNPIARLRRGAEPLAPSANLTITLDGRATDYFEWLPAGLADADLGHGAMARAGRLLRTLRFGVTADCLAVRLDTVALSAADALAGLVAVIEIAAPRELRLRAPLRRGAWQSGPVQGHLDRVLEMLVPLAEIHASSESRLEMRIDIEDQSGRRIESVPAEGFVAFAARAEQADWVV